MAKHTLKILRVKTSGMRGIPSCLQKVNIFTIVLVNWKISDKTSIESLILLKIVNMSEIFRPWLYIIQNLGFSLRMSVAENLQFSAELFEFTEKYILGNFFLFHVSNAS